jgi:tripartite-type tricarboxylate transporter receptor subunit TctC
MTIRSVAQSLAFAALLAAAAAGSSSAQTYPSQDIHIICAFPAGSGADIIARYYAEKIRALSGRNTIVENKPGAVSNIATEYVARAKPDGYTIYIQGGSSIAANMSLFKNPPVDVTKAIQVAAPINRQPFMIAVDIKKPWKTIADLTAALKEKKDKASFATMNPSSKVMALTYKNAAGLEAVEVQYRTASDSANDLASGQLDFAAYDPIYAMTQAREGRVRILGISTAVRLEAAPELLTMKEQGVDMDLMGWFAAMVPMGTPKPVVDQIAKWVNEITATPDAKKFLNSIGGDPWIATSEEAQARLVKDVNDWSGYVKAAKIEPQG